MNDNFVADLTHSDVRSLVDDLIGWIEDRDWMGFDPYDGLRTLPFRPRSKRLRQVQIQVPKMSPANLRRLFRATPYAMSKSIAVGLMAMQALGDDERAEALRTRLVETRLDNGLWGYEFDVQTRWAFYSAGTPNAIATSFSLHGLLDHEVDYDQAEILEKATRRLINQFLIESPGGPFFRYVVQSDVLVHNANLLTAAAVARVARQLNIVDWEERAREAAMTSIAHQADSGAWSYGEGSQLGWVDGLHTAYVLVALDWLALPGMEPHIERGLQFYLKELFADNGRPLARASSQIPGDVHTVATSLWVLSRFSDREGVPGAIQATYEWALRLRKGDGSYRLSHLNPISYVRWGQAHMLLGLASLLSILEDPER